MGLGDLRLLLIEDNPGDQRLFREMLRDLGYPGTALVVVERVEEATGRLARQSFDVAFLDLELPDSSGLETLQRVREAGRDVPVIVFTGLDDEAVGDEAVAHGAQDYLVKGAVHADVLARVIRYAVSRHHALAASRRESARAAAAEARLTALEESRAALEHEVAERRATQADLERTLARVQGMRSIDRAVIANQSVEPMLQVVLHEGVRLLEVEAAAVRLLRGDRLVQVAQYGLPELAAADDRLPWDGPEELAALCQGALTLDLEHVVPGELPRVEQLRLAGFRSCHVVGLQARSGVLGTLELFSRGVLRAEPDWSEFVATLADQAVVAVESARLQLSLMQANRDLIETYDATIDGWSHALDLRDRETEGHSRRVTELTLELARAFGINGHELGHMRRGALLHDIGKMGVPDTILQKPGALDDAEWEVMRRHTTFAYDLLHPIAYLRPALEIPYAHHERWDGSGYPRGLSGEQIPFSARIFAVADVYDALTSDRPYRRAWSRERALHFIRAGAGSHFDPTVVKAFLELQLPDPATVERGLATGS